MKKDKKDKKKYGHITVGVGTPNEKKLEIINFVQCEFKDERKISVAEIEDGTFPLFIHLLPPFWISNIYNFINFISKSTVFFPFSVS